ncbi:MAG: DUF4190 domain-containing protein [Phycisphaerae bacterium]|nr:DUF4190 domain-containing protein [Phycisphaerae bacterium]
MTSIPPIQPTAYQQQTATALQPGHQKSARLSIAALVMGIIALIPFLGLLFALLGLIFGIIALAKKHPKSGLAITGIVLSGLGLLITPATSAGILLHSYCESSVSTYQSDCFLDECSTVDVSVACELTVEQARGISMTNLNRIHKAIKMHDAEYDQYPQQLSQLIEEDLGKGTLNYPGKWELGVAYFYLAPAKDAPAETIMACEKAGFDENDRNVLSADGSVQRITNDEFAEALAKPHNAKFAKALKRAEGP